MTTPALLRVLALPLITTVLAAGPAAGEEGRVSGARLLVTGSATLEVPPDLASVSIGVQNRAATASAAIDATSAAAAKVAASAKAAGIEARDIRTSQLSLQPVYRSVRDPNGGAEQKPDGYQAGNSVLIRVRDLGRLGTVLRTLVDEGANRIGGIEMELADPGRVEREAEAAAVRDARARAETIADAAGLKLGRVEEIRSGGSDEGVIQPRRRSRAMAAAAPGMPLPVEGGTLAVSASVTLTYAVEPR